MLTHTAKWVLASSGAEPGETTAYEKLQFSASPKWPSASSSSSLRHAPSRSSASKVREQCQCPDHPQPEPQVEILVVIRISGSRSFLPSFPPPRIVPLAPSLSTREATNTCLVSSPPVPLRQLTLAASISPLRAKVRVRAILCCQAAARRPQLDPGNNKQSYSTLYPLVYLASFQLSKDLLARIREITLCVTPFLKSKGEKEHNLSGMLVGRQLKQFHPNRAHKSSAHNPKFLPIGQSDIATPYRWRPPLNLQPAASTSSKPPSGLPSNFTRRSAPASWTH